MRGQLTEAIAQSSGDVGVLVSLGSTLLGGGDLERRLVEAAQRAQDALVAAFRARGLAATVLALPEVGALLEVLFPRGPFEMAVSSAQVALMQSGPVADAEVQLVVPGDVEATRAAVDGWAGRPAGLGCMPPAPPSLAEAVADLPAAATCRRRRGHAPAVRGDARDDRARARPAGGRGSAWRSTSCVVLAAERDGASNVRPRPTRWWPRPRSRAAVAWARGCWRARQLPDLTSVLLPLA